MADIPYDGPERRRDAVIMSDRLDRLESDMRSMQSAQVEILKVTSGLDTKIGEIVPRVLRRSVEAWIGAMVLRGAIAILPAFAVWLWHRYHQSVTLDR
jgi:hypothetical protein